MLESRLCVGVKTKGEEVKTGGDVLDVGTTIWHPVQELLVGSRCYVLFHTGQPFLYFLRCIHYEKVYGSYFHID